MPSMFRQFCAGDGLRRGLAAARRHERIVDTVDHECRSSHVCSPCGPVARRQDRDQLAGDAELDRGRGSSSRRLSARDALLVDGKALAADDLGRDALTRTAASSTVCGGAPVSTSSASGSAVPTVGSPVVDMIEHSDSVLSGCSMANAWAIIPPIDAPTMCAAGMPSASSRPAGISGHVAERVRGRRCVAHHRCHDVWRRRIGKCVLRPTSRLSNRMT